MDQKLAMTIGAFAAAALLPATAHAAPVTNGDGRATAEILDPIAVLEISDLDFGTVVTSALPGTVTIPANGAAPVYAGGVAGLAADPLFRGEFLAVGEPGREIIITYAYPPVLTSISGDTIALLAMFLDGNAVKTLDGTTGQVPFHFGGTIFVGGNQPEGLYEANFDVTVDYR